MATPFTELVGCPLPIQLAGLGGGIGTPELAVAVARAGGLGLIGYAYGPDELVAVLDAIGDAAPGCIGVNILMPFLDPAVVDAAAPRVRVVDFFYGAPDASLVARVHAGGALASWQVGDEREAAAAVDAGCDFVIAQGTEAGGHVRGRMPLAEVLERVREAVPVPVLAAGGIATAADVAAVLAAGADGVRVGTRFVAADESGAHPDYVAALIGADATETELTSRFEVGWPDAPHRVLASCVAAAEARRGDDVVGYSEAGNHLTPIERWSAEPPTRATDGEIAAMALYAGTSVGAVQSRQPAAAVVRDLMAGASPGVFAQA